MNRDYKDIARRAGKTFIQAFIPVFLLGTVGIQAALAVGAISAVISIIMNLFNISPTSIPGRAGSTFLQTFLATWAVTGYEFTTGVIVSAAAAAFSAAMNFVKETA